jgi:hypothetical protein
LQRYKKAKISLDMLAKISLDRLSHSTVSSPFTTLQLLDYSHFVCTHCYSFALSSSALVLSSLLFSHCYRYHFLSVTLLLSPASSAVVLFISKNGATSQSYRLHIIATYYHSIWTNHVIARVSTVSFGCPLFWTRCVHSCASASLITSFWYAPPPIIFFSILEYYTNTRIWHWLYRHDYLDKYIMNILPIAVATIN